MMQRCALAWSASLCASLCLVSRGALHPRQAPPSRCQATAIGCEAESPMTMTRIRHVARAAGFLARLLGVGADCEVVEPEVRLPREDGGVQPAGALELPTYPPGVYSSSNGQNSNGNGKTSQVVTVATVRPGDLLDSQSRCVTKVGDVDSQNRTCVRGGFTEPPHNAVFWWIAHLTTFCWLVVTEVPMLKR